MADYKVGIELLLASNGEAVLGVLARRLLGVHGQVKDLEGGFGSLKTAIAGAFAIAGAVALLGVMNELVKKGAELENQMYRLQTAGFTPKQMADVKANAGRVAAQYRNLTEGELIKLTAETTMVYGDPRIAMNNLSTVAAYVAAVKYRHPEDPEGAAATAEDAVFKILRSTEMRGIAQDPAEVQKALTAVLRGQEAFGDENFDPNTVFQAVRYGRLASRYFSDRFLYGPGMIAAQELGGSNYGNSVNQIMQAFVGGHITKSALEEAEKIGLIDPHKVIMGHGRGSGTGFNLGDAVPQRSLLQTDPDLWFQRVFAPIVDKASHGDTSARDQILRQLFFRTTGQQVAEMLGWQMGPGGRFYKDVQRLDQAMTPEQAVAAAMGNLSTTTEDLNTQFQRLSTNIGDPMAKALGGALGNAVAPVRGLANFFGDHPVAAGATGVAIGAGALGLGGYGIWKFVTLGKRLVDSLLNIAPKGGAAEELGTTAGGIGRLASSINVLGALKFLSIASEIGALADAMKILGDTVKAPPTKDTPQTPTLHPGPLNIPMVGHGSFGPSGNDLGIAIGGGGHINPRHPASYNGGAQLQGAVYLDGKKVGLAVFAPVLSAMNTSPNSGPGFDGSANMSHVSQLSVT